MFVITNKQDDARGSANIGASVALTVTIYISAALSILLAIIGILSGYSLVAQLGISSVFGCFFFWFFLLMSVKKEIGKISSMILFTLAVVCGVVATLFLIDGFWVVILSMQIH